MSAEQRTVSPFATPETYSTSLSLCSAVKQFYKVKNSAIWYIENRKRVIDKALPDPFCFAKFETIHAWHEYHALKLAHAA